jgi:glycosyltransferase involved in cell wall biosynthesis
LLKTLFVLGFPNPFPGAAWTRIGFFAKDWSKKGHSVEVLGIFSYESLQERGARKIGNVNIFNLIFNVGLGHPLVFTINSLVSFIVSTLFLIARKPSIAIVSVPTGDVGLGAIMACRLIGVKYVVDYRDEWEEYEISLTNCRNKKSFYSAVKKLMASLYSKSHLKVAVTSSFISHLEHRGVTNIRLVPNGADVTVFNPYDKYGARKKLGLNANDFIIVYSGIIGAYYRLEIVIKALVKLRDVIKNIKFIIIGEGPALATILRLSKELGLRNEVLYLGVKNEKSQIAEILVAGDTGIIPGVYSKGQVPAKFFEYCACGVPVIATLSENSLLARMINEHKVGLTVPSMDEKKLSEAILWMHKNESFRLGAGKRARLLVEMKFDRSTIAEEFFRLIEEVI